MRKLLTTFNANAKHGSAWRLDHAYRLIAKTVAQRRWHLRTLPNYSRYGLLAGINADNGARWIGWPP
jgi:hypothetical protein